MIYDNNPIPPKQSHMTPDDSKCCEIRKLCKWSLDSWNLHLGVWKGLPSTRTMPTGTWKSASSAFSRGWIPGCLRAWNFGKMFLTRISQSIVCPSCQWSCVSTMVKHCGHCQDCVSCLVWNAQIVPRFFLLGSLWSCVWGRMVCCQLLSYVFICYHQRWFSFFWCFSKRSLCIFQCSFA